MDSITLTYLHPATGAPQTRTIPVLRVKGFDPIDSLSDFPGSLFSVIDGSLLHRSVGVRRNFLVEFGVLSQHLRLFCAEFWRAETKFLSYVHDGITDTTQVVRKDGTLDTEWIDNSVVSRYVVLPLVEKNILSKFPDNRNYPVPEYDMYIKKKVLIAGTVDSPETFSTGSGKLSTCDAPSGPYPYFDDTIQKYDIEVSRTYQDCHFFVPSVESTTAGVLTFTVARSDAGNPASDGGYYADIIIKAVNIV